MSERRVFGYARVSTGGQDLEAQLVELERLGVPREDVHVDHGLTGRNRDRPGLATALAAVRSGERLVVTKLDRLARSLPDARDIAGELAERGVELQIGTTRYDPTDPIGRLLFNVLAMVAEFEADLISQRTKEGMAIAREKGRLKGRPPKLSGAQEAHLLKLHTEGEHTVADLCELFGVTRATVYRALERARAAAGDAQAS